MRRIALSAATLAVAIAGSLTAGGPAQAADDEGDGTHCVATVPATNVRCFETYAEAKAFVESVAETAPDKKPSAAAQRAYGEAMQANPLVFLPVWIFTGFDAENYNPIWGTYSIIALTGGPCTTTIADTDYTKATLPARWDNDISSYIDLSNCWTRLYEDANFGGAFRGYTGDSATLGAWNNRASSIKWS